MNSGSYLNLKRNIFITGAACLIVLFSATLLAFLYLSDAFRPRPVVTVHADNVYEKTLRVVTDMDYEPFSYINSDGEYMGMDVELITEIANRLHMNLDLKLMDWPTANELFFGGKADVFLNMETDSVVNDSRMIATLPTAEKQYVVYGRESVSSVPELYGRRVASLHSLPELGLGDGITYINSYAEIFEALKRGEYDFAICPIQVGNVFLEKLSMTDVKPSYAVGHVYGAIALRADNKDLKERMDAVISDMQKEGRLAELDRKWVSHRYQSMTLKGMIESHPEILVAFFVTLFFIVLLLIYLILQRRNMRDKDAYSKELQEKIETIDRQNEELLIAKERAEESNKAKSAFLSSMSHEIRTPINAVLGMNEMIIREASQGKASSEVLNQISSYAGNVERAGKSLLSIINDILDFSKIDAGKIEVVSASYKLSSVLNDAINMIMFRAREKGLEFQVKVDETLPDGLLGDEVRVRQVLTNVLSNAVKYTKEGKISLFARGEKTSEETIRLIFSVTDTGIGIRQEDIGKLFNKFERMDISKNKTVEGTGLGLAITKNLLELMEGDITAESEYGKGSVFTIYIPQKVISWEQIGNFHEKFERATRDGAVYRESFRAPDARILVVDDTEMNLTVVIGLLEKTEVKIDTAPSGADALRMTEHIPYDLIFMDQMMPNMDGTEALQRIRKQEGGVNTGTPVLCLTADAVSGAREEYLRQGFTDYLSKPIEGTKLEATLIKYLPPQKVTMQKTSSQESTDNSQASNESSRLKDIYSKAEGLDYSEAIKFCSNEAILEKTLRPFYQAIDSNSKDIENFLAEKDYKNYTIKVHALKSSARLIGAGQLSSDARFLEECGDNLSEENIRIINERTPKLLADYRAYKEKLQPLYADENKDLPEIKLEELSEIYEAIREFAFSFDIDSIDNIIAEARKHKIPESESSRFEAIETAARNMDWSALEEALKK